MVQSSCSVKNGKLNETIEVSALWSKGSECYSTRIKLFYFDDNFCCIARGCALLCRCDGSSDVSLCDSG